MKKFGKIFRRVVSTVLLLYILLILLLHVPFIQQKIGDGVANALSEKIGTKVSIGRVNVGFLNCLIIDDIYVEDQQGQQMLKIARATTSFDFLPLFTGTFSISTAQLFGVDAHLYKQTPQSEANFDFVIKAFASTKPDEESLTFDMRIHSLILRNIAVRYDVLSEPKTPGIFNPNHLQIEDAGLTASLKYLTSDSLNVSIKRLNFLEKKSGFTFQDLDAKVEANTQTAKLQQLKLQTNSSTLQLTQGILNYAQWGTQRKFQFDGNLEDCTLVPSDFKAFAPKLAAFDTPLHFATNLHLTENLLHVLNLQIYDNNRNIDVSADIRVHEIQTPHPDIVFNIKGLKIVAETMKKIVTHLFDNNKEGSQWVPRIGSLQMKGLFQTNKELAVVKADLQTDAGQFAIDGDYDFQQKFFNAHVQSEKLNLQQLLNNPSLGDATFNLTTQGTLNPKGLPEGEITGTIESIDFNGYAYQNIKLEGKTIGQGYEGTIDINDDNLQLAFNGSIQNIGLPNTHTDMQIQVPHFNPHALHLTSQHANEIFGFNANVNATGSTLETINGHFKLDSIQIKLSGKNIRISELDLFAEQISNKQKHLSITSDFLSVSLDGDFKYEQLPAAFESLLSRHIPSLFPSTSPLQDEARLSFDVEIIDSPLLHYLFEKDYALPKPISLSGDIDTRTQQSTVLLNAPAITYEGSDYKNIRLNYASTPEQGKAEASLQSKEEGRNVQVQLQAKANNDKLYTNLKWEQDSSKPTTGDIHTTTTFTNQQVLIGILPSSLSFNDTIWNVTSSSINIFDKKITCNDVKIERGHRYISVNGVVSDNPSDILTAKLNDMELAYLQSLTNFRAVSFQGRATGIATISNVQKQPLFNAELNISDLCLKDGMIGNGILHANWDEEHKGIALNGHFDDSEAEQKRSTDLHGYISTGNKTIDLHIDAHNTRADFLNGFLGRTFQNIHGKVNGDVNVVGPLNDVNVVGDVSADVYMTLKATKATYHINPADSIHMRPVEFLFDSIRLYDRHGNQGLVNGKLTHRNMKNFGYEFKIEMQNLLAYEEAVFNSDKFMGNIMVNGWLEINGSDHHPLNITAEVTPVRGSFFAYDSGTPEAIVNQSFITFNDPTQSKEEDDGSETSNNQNNQYRGDIYMDVIIHLTPDCTISLRMDNNADGYINTYGQGTLKAHYHNKGAFTLNGNYEIEKGDYRLYLQDVIYRDLALQSGSRVVFNGNPFDANIHLICWHTINSVPLNDLTTSSSFNANSKAKVICVLDITGQLGNMNFNFDLQLPNVSDETRQLVRSLISTDEEMNQQMIYLLGVGRFFRNEYTRASGGGGNSSGAMNNLLSSTISGQINQMLNNVIGTDSKWNFGTGLSTGEHGWDDLDIEGVLSGRLLDDRLLINGNFGYRDNAMTQNASFIGDFDVRWRIRPKGNTYLKAYNQNNDRYFTKSTLNTQGIGVSYQKDFDQWRQLFRRRKKDARN